MTYLDGLHDEGKREGDTIMGTCGATFTRGGLTLRCDKQDHSDDGGMFDDGHYDFHLDAVWDDSWLWDVGTETFVRTLRVHFRVPEQS